MCILTYANLNVSAGVSHQKSNLAAMIRETFLAGRDLLVPDFHLAGIHNYGRPLVSQMDEYFDYGHVIAGGKPIKMILAHPKCFTQVRVNVALNEPIIGRTESQIIKDVNRAPLVRNQLEKIYAFFSTIPVQIPVHPTLVQIAEIASKRIPANSVWVHARRGDLLQRTAAATTPENIGRVIRDVAPDAQTVYIATNEANLDVFAPLTDCYDLIWSKDFDLFNALGRENNYKLFLVEQAFAVFFDVRISTFKVDGEFFHGSLCNLPGWQ